jgi:hypothetical protein
MTTISFIIYELAQPLLGKPIDPRDIIATVLTGGLCVLIYRMIHQSKTRPANLGDKKKKECSVDEMASPHQCI